MGNTQQAGVKKDDHGGSSSRHQQPQPQAASVAPDLLRAGDQQPQATSVALAPHHGGCSRRDQQPQATSVVDLHQFQAGAADGARNRMQPPGGAHDVETTSNSKAASDGDGDGDGDGDYAFFVGDYAFFVSEAACFRGGCSRDQQPQATSVVDLHQFQAGAADGARNRLQPPGGAHDVETTSNSKLRNCNSSATDGGDRSSKIDIHSPIGESVNLRHDNDPYRPSLPEPEFVLQTSRVKSGCIGDGDGFTAYAKKVAGVAVGGSYKIGDTKYQAPQQYRIRMRGIDAPELKMEHGVESKNELVKLIGGKCVTIDVYGTDQFRRYLGDIYCDGMFIQEEMLKRGFAWYFRAGEERPELARWEREAREARQGIWSSDNPQRPWEWKRDHPRINKKDSANEIQVELQSQGNESIGSLPCMISKDMETLGRQWKKKLEKFVADNVEQNCHLQELKRNKKEAEDRAKELEKEMESVVADNMKLNDQLEESVKDKEKADDRISKLTFFSESVVAINMDLHSKLGELKEKNKKAEDRAKVLEKEMGSVVAVNTELNDQLEELKGSKKVAEDRAAELKFSYDSVAVVNKALRDELEELRKKNKEAEDRSKESKKEMRSVVADNMKLNGQIQRLNNKVFNNARNHKKKLQSVIAINMDLSNKLLELQKNSEKAQDKAEESEKETENVVAEDLNLGETRQENAEEAVETTSAAPLDKDSSGGKETIVMWRKKTAATTSQAPQSQAPPAECHCEMSIDRVYMLRSSTLTG